MNCSHIVVHHWPTLLSPLPSNARLNCGLELIQQQVMATISVGNYKQHTNLGNKWPAGLMSSVTCTLNWVSLWWMVQFHRCGRLLAIYTLMIKTKWNYSRADCHLHSEEDIHVRTLFQCNESSAGETVWQASFMVAKMTHYGSLLAHLTVHVMEHDGCRISAMQAAVQVCNMQINLRVHIQDHISTHATHLSTTCSVKCA